VSSFALLLVNRRHPLLSEKVLLPLTFLLAIGYFVLALQAFERGERKTFDEYVYHRMGLQLQQDPNAYHTLPLALTTKFDSPPPEYLTRPLFKHPPLFSYIIVIAQSLGGDRFIVSAIVPALFGAATILLTFCLGTLCYNRVAGFLSAALLTLNPIHIICGQRIWLATTLTFFMTAALLLTVLAIRRKQPMLFLLASMAIGLAGLTKYPGLLLLPLLLIPVFRARPPRWILAGFITIPFLCLLPWLQWNLEVYGSDFLWNTVIIHFRKHIRHNPELFYYTLAISVALIAAAIWLIARSKIRSFPTLSILPPSGDLRVLTTWALGGALLLPFLAGLNWTYFPETSWEMGFFADAPRTFYIERLLIYSPFVLGAFLLIPWTRQQPASAQYLFLTCLGLLVFFTLWGAYQCRYVEPILPGLMVLAAQSIILAIKSPVQIQFSKYSIRLSWLLGALILYAVVRMVQFNIHFSYPNTVCYF